MATVPTLVAELALGAAPYTVSPSWTDISAYVRVNEGVTVDRGRSEELSSFSPGRISLTLENRDRRFDPLYAAGPYFGNLRPRTPIRLRGLWSAVNYPIIRGFVESWPQRHDADKANVTVALSGYDSMVLLPELICPDPVVPYMTGTLGSVLRACRPVIGTSWVDMANGSNWTLTSGNAVTAPSMVASSTSQALDISSGRWTSPGGETSAPWTFAFWLSTSPTTTGQLLFGGFAAFAVNSSGYLTFTGATTATSVKRVDDQVPRFVVGTCSGTTGSLYVDGILQGTCTINAGFTAPDHSTADNYPITPGLAFVQNMSAFTIALTGAQVSTLYDYERGVILEDASTRAGRLADLVGFPSGLRSFTGTVDVGEYAPLGKDFLSQLQQVADSEHGRLFVDASGVLTMQSRYAYMTTTRGLTSQVTLTDAAAGPSYEVWSTDLNDLDVVNDATVTGTGGVYGTVTDSASKSAYGPRSVSVDSVLATEDGSRLLAAALVYMYATPITRLQPLRVPVAVFTASMATLLSLEIGDRITATMTPAVGAAITLLMTIERLSWDIDSVDWRLTIGGVPVPGNAVAGSSFFVLDNATYGVLGTGLLGF